MIDMKIPLPYILSGIVSLALCLAGMFFQLRQLGEDMTDIKAKVSQATKVSEQLAVLTYRVQTLESGRSATAGGK